MSHKRVAFEVIFFGLIGVIFIKIMKLDMRPTMWGIIIGTIFSSTSLYFNQKLFLRGLCCLYCFFMFFMIVCFPDELRVMEWIYGHLIVTTFAIMDISFTEDNHRRLIRSGTFR
jgi:hypothetical protein